MRKLISIVALLVITFGFAFGQTPATDTEKVVPYFKLEVKPTIIKKVPPAYPEFAIKAGVEGQVIIKVIIDQDGNVIVANILKSVPMLDESALSAVKERKFSPGKLGGVPVKVNMIVPVQFKMRR